MTAKARVTANLADPLVVARGRKIYARLAKTYPEATCALLHDNAFQLLVATILSAQCTDERVNKVTPGLFAMYPGPEALAGAGRQEVEEAIKSTGFYRNKAKALRASSRDIMERFHGQVPDTMDGLLSLHGVARKTANVVLGNAFGKNVGVVVDTHVSRLSQRMALTTQTTPEKIERDLMAIFPRKNWTVLSHLLIWHGRRFCKARKPNCDECPVRSLCPRAGVAVSRGGVRQA